MKHILLTRHAASDDPDPELNDIDRPLNKHGLHDTPLMGQRLINREIKPQAIISSTAVRAMTTAVLLAKELDCPSDKILRNENVYTATPDQLMDIIRNFDNGKDWIMMMGHNPSISQLVSILCGDFVQNMPTCGIYALECQVDDWQAVGPHSAKILFFEYPKPCSQQKAG